MTQEKLLDEILPWPFVMRRCNPAPCSSGLSMILDHLREAAADYFELVG